MFRADTIDEISDALNDLGERPEVARPVSESEFILAMNAVDNEDVFAPEVLRIFRKVLEAREEELLLGYEEADDTVVTDIGITDKQYFAEVIDDLRYALTEVLYAQ